MESDRPVLEREIEVTPEMIEAGAEVLLDDYSHDFGPSEAKMFSEEIIKRALKVYLCGISVSRL